MNSKRATLGDVAREAGVSPTTASFVLTDREGMRISEATARRVRAASAKLGYRPNMAARGLRASSTMTFGLVSDRIGSSPYAGEMLHGAIDRAGDADHLVIITETEDDDADRGPLVAAMLDRRVDGLIFGAMFTREVVVPSIVSTVPHVFLNCLPGERTGPAVIPDERAGGRTAAATLLDAGHTDHVVYIGGRHVTATTLGGVYAGHERSLGIAEEFRRHGHRLAAVVECGWEPDEGYDAVRTVLRRAARPSALICANDRVALGAYQALADAGLTVPHDVSIVSFDDSELARWLRPSLSSVALPHHRLGATAVGLLLAGNLTPTLHRVPMPLARRASVAPL